jgi:hypothetical protein
VGPRDEALAKVCAEASEGEWTVLGILIGAAMLLALYLFREKGRLGGLD